MKSRSSSLGSKTLPEKYRYFQKTLNIRTSISVILRGIFRLHASKDCTGASLADLLDLEFLLSKWTIYPCPFVDGNNLNFMNSLLSLSKVILEIVFSSHQVSKIFIMLKNQISSNLRKNWKENNVLAAILRNF